MIDPARRWLIHRSARGPTNWHRGRHHQSWMALPGMYGVVWARRDPATRTWIAWVRNGEHDYPACPPQATRTDAVVTAVEIAFDHGFQG